MLCSCQHEQHLISVGIASGVDNLYVNFIFQTSNAALMYFTEKLEILHSVRQRLPATSYAHVTVEPSQLAS